MSVKAPSKTRQPVTATTEYELDIEKPYCSLSEATREAPVYEKVQYHK